MYSAVLHHTKITSYHVYVYDSKIGIYCITCGRWHDKSVEKSEPSSPGSVCQ